MTHAVGFRKHVLHIKREENLTLQETSQRFKIGIASLVRWSKKIEPKEKRDKAPTKLDMEALKKDIADYPDAYQYERALRLGVTAQGIWHALRRLNVTYKKKPSASQSQSRKAFYVLPTTGTVSKRKPPYHQS